MLETERRIVFGQVFHPEGDNEKPLFVVIDTSPTNYPESIAAVEIVIKETEQGNIERLGLPGSFDPKTVEESKDVWPLDKIIDGMGKMFGGNLPEGIKEELKQNSQKPPREI